MFLEDREHGPLAPAEVAVIETFAGLAALATRAARHASELATQAAVISRQQGAFAELVDSQQLVERAVRDGADAARLVRTLARRVGKPVAYFDADLHLITSTADDAELRDAVAVLPAAAERHEWVRRTIGKLDGRQRSTVLPPAIADGLAWRHLVGAVTVDAEVVGYVVVLEIGRRLSVHDLRLADHVATALGVRARLDRGRGESAAWLGRRLVDDLLAGTDDTAGRARRAAALGLDLGHPHLLLRIEARAGDLIAAAGEAVATLQAALGPTVASITTDGAMVVVVGSLQSEPDVRAALHHVIAGAERTGIDLVAGFAVVGREDGDHGPAAAALGVVLTVATEPVVRLAFGDLLGALTHDRAFQHVRVAGRDLLAPLLEHDESNDSNLVATLRAFLDANGQIRDTAAALDVHTNTVRYRLGRIRELSRIDPCRVDSLLEARLALQLHDQH
jgi:hypothetical protein